MTVTTSLISYDGRLFRPADGDDDAATGVYHQRDDLIWAEFSGRQVRTGRLVGTCGADGRIDAAYCFVTAAGAVVAGTCVSTPTVAPDGRVALAEHWRRMDGSTGVSYLEEITQ
jgi:hypothetical protein